ncbi:hypothetical protein MSUIS_07090 [Mycoplasma suis KI3806]|nr:hypothetical protein [Mycoplasma suis]CBZ40802.1 hypothetical protein MSUIS_07090 [Mycoplasma suis KI3806]
MGLISLGGIGGGVGSGLGSIFNSEQTPQNKLVSEVESPEKGLSDGKQELVQISDNQSSQSPIKGIHSRKEEIPESPKNSVNKEQVNSRVKRELNSESGKTNKKVSKSTPKKESSQNKTTSYSSPLIAPKLTEEERKQEVTVKSISGNGISCLHTWWWGVYQGGAVCRSKN